jgi:hypothetical protein
VLGSGSWRSSGITTERDSLDAFDQVVDGFGWAVGHLGVVPGCDLVGPALQGAAELANLGRGLVLEVSCEAGDPREGGVGIAGHVNVADAFLSVNLP